MSTMAAYNGNGFSNNTNVCPNSKIADVAETLANNFKKALVYIAVL